MIATREAQETLQNAKRVNPLRRPTMQMNQHQPIEGCKIFEESIKGKRPWGGLSKMAPFRVLPQALAAALLPHVLCVKSRMACTSRGDMLGHRLWGPYVRKPPWKPLAACILGGSTWAASWLSLYEFSLVIFMHSCCAFHQQALLWLHAQQERGSNYSTIQQEGGLSCSPAVLVGEKTGVARFLRLLPSSSSGLLARLVYPWVPLTLEQKIISAEQDQPQRGMVRRILCSAMRWQINLENMI